jgi:hypothetical protein
LQSCVNDIFALCSKELILTLEGLNLLQSEASCFASSTAIGFCLEEFLVSKLIEYTNNNPRLFYKIKKHNIGTATSSYDCYSDLSDGSKCLINIKADKSNNNAVAAINVLHKDYAKDKPNEIKHYLVLKVHYQIKLGESSKKIKEKVIYISNIESYYLEEISFINGYKSDSRN